MATLRQWAKSLKTETLALYLATKDPRTPWYAKLLGLCIVGYALSPIDLIPDPIPLLGYLDDLILIPLGLLLVRRLIPPIVLQDARQRAATLTARPSNWIAAAIILTLWLLTAALLVWWLWKILRLPPA